MGHYALAVKFMEYTNFIYKSPSKQPYLSGGAFADRSGFYPDKNSARIVKNKFVYIFQRDSKGIVAFNREMKADNDGKFTVYINKSKDKIDAIRKPGTKKHDYIFFDAKSIESGSKYYFCLSQFQWSKARIDVIMEQLRKGRCKRLISLPIYKKHESRHSEDEREYVSYSNDNTTKVYLIDYMDVAYSNEKGLYQQCVKEWRGYNRWLNGNDENEGNLPRAKLKAIIDSIWRIESIDTGKTDFKKTLLEYIHRAKKNYLEEVYSVGRYIRFQPPKEIKEKIAGNLKKIIIGDSEKAVKNYSVYRNKLKKIDPIKDSDKIKTLGKAAPGRSLTYADYWKYRYETTKSDMLLTISTFTISLIEWIRQEEFISMQHDYFYGNNDEKDKHSVIFLDILSIISQISPGIKYLKEELSRAIYILDKLGEDSDNKKMITEVYDKKLEDISEMDELKLLKCIGTLFNESNSLATALFIPRKQFLASNKLYEIMAISLVGTEDIGLFELFKKLWLNKLVDKVGDLAKNKKLFNKARYNKLFERIIRSPWAKGCDDIVGNLLIGLELYNITVSLLELAESKDGYEIYANISALAGSFADLFALILGKAGNKAASRIFGVIGAAFDFHMFSALAAKRLSLNDSDAMIFYSIAAGGAFLTFAGLIFGGSPLIVAGIIIQIIGTHFARLFTDDDFQVWINHCYWGDNAKTDSNIITDFSPVPLKKWYKNLDVQLEAFSTIAYSFKAEVKVWKEMTYPLIPECGTLAIVITPKYINENSKLYLSLWLEKGGNRDEPKVLVEFARDRLVALNENMLTDEQKSDTPELKKKMIEEGKGYIIPYIEKSPAGNIRKLAVSWYDPDYIDHPGIHNFQVFPDSNPHRFRYHGIKRDGLRTLLIDKEVKLKARIYLDIDGDGRIMIPSTMEKVGLNDEYHGKDFEDSIKEFYVYG